jgi:hypothetical protein
VEILRKWAKGLKTGREQSAGVMEICTVGFALLSDELTAIQDTGRQSALRSWCDPSAQPCVQTSGAYREPAFDITLPSHWTSMDSIATYDIVAFAKWEGWSRSDAYMHAARLVSLKLRVVDVGLYTSSMHSLRLGSKSHNQLPQPRTCLSPLEFVVGRVSTTQKMYQ